MIKSKIGIQNMVSKPPCPFPGCIVGIGTDMVDGQRMQRALARTPRLVQRLFTPQEQAYARTQHHPHMTLAKRFAAKEAFAKAAGCGIGSTLSWTDISVERESTGQPSILLSHRAYANVHHRVGGDFHILCSLTDDTVASHPVALAMVIIQRT